MPQRPQDTNPIFSLRHPFVPLYFCGLFILLFTTHSLAQQKTISINAKDIAFAYVDRPGDLYILKQDNVLMKIDQRGMVVSEQSFSEPLSLFEPRDGARMFAYHNQSQRCYFFSAETKQEYKIEQEYAINPILVCSSGDYHIWILDSEDFSLKRVNPVQSKVIVDTPINTKQFTTAPEIKSMREYQGFLFMHEKNTGIIIFNSIGMQIKKIPGANIEYFNFIGEELYYKVNDKLIFLDLFDSSTREERLVQGCKLMLFTDTTQYTQFEDRLEISKKP
jgi:hypothetical protein